MGCNCCKKKSPLGENLEMQHKSSLLSQDDSMISNPDYFESEIVKKKKKKEMKTFTKQNKVTPEPNSEPQLKNNDSLTHVYELSQLEKKEKKIEKENKIDDENNFNEDDNTSEKQQNIEIGNHNSEVEGNSEMEKIGNYEIEKNNDSNEKEEKDEIEEKKAEEVNPLDDDVEIVTGNNIEESKEEYTISIMKESQNDSKDEEDISNKKFKNLKLEVDDDTLDVENMLNPEILSPMSNISATSLIDEIKDPIDLSNKTKEDLKDVKIVEELSNTIEDLFDRYEEKLQEEASGYKKITTDGKYGELDLEIKVKTVNTEGNCKMHITRQKYKLKAGIEQFLYTCHDKDVQMRINNTLTFYELISELPYRDDTVIQFYHTKTKRVMIIDPRETLFMKVLRRYPDGSITSINKSILLKKEEEEEEGKKKLKLVNIELSGYKYSLNEDGFVHVSAYSATDLRMKTGLFMAKGFIRKGVLDFINGNFKELEKLQEEDEEFEKKAKVFNF